MDMLRSLPRGMHSVPVPPVNGRHGQIPIVAGGVIMVVVKIECKPVLVTVICCTRNPNAQVAGDRQTIIAASNGDGGLNRQRERTFCVHGEYGYGVDTV